MCYNLVIFKGQSVAEEEKPQLAQHIFNYLQQTTPLMLIAHLFYIGMLCAIFSTAYVVAFHWTSLVHIYDEAHSIKNFSDNLKTSVETDNAISQTLDRILSQTNGQRAYVYRYHNGLAAISSVPFFFQTMTHESIAPGTSRLMQYEQRIPVGISMNINHAFVSGKCATILNTDEDPQHQNYYFFQSRGARSLVRCPIYMSNGDLFGFVGVDFIREMTNPKQDEQIIHDATTSISRLFSNLRR
jgi:GAF domain